MWIVYNPFTNEIKATFYTMKAARAMYKCDRNPKMETGFNRIKVPWGLDKTDNVKHWKLMKALSKDYTNDY